MQLSLQKDKSLAQPMKTPTNIGMFSSVNSFVKMSAFSVFVIAMQNCHQKATTVDGVSGSDCSITRNR